MLSVLLIGRVCPAGLDDAVGDDGSLDVCLAADGCDADSRLAGGASTPELIVLCQERPGEFTAEAIDALRRRAPLARVWRVLGPWCEGETRSGTPPKGCLASHGHAFEAHLARGLKAVARGAAAGWSLPVTATFDERTLADLGHGPDTRCTSGTSDTLARRSGVIGISAASRPAAEALADVCRRAGYTTVLDVANRPSHVAGTAALLWDTTCRLMADAAHVATLRRRAGRAPIVAVVGFPRPDDIAASRAAGVAAVVAKPFAFEDLVWHVDRAIGGR